MKPFDWRITKPVSSFPLPPISSLSTGWILVSGEVSHFWWWVSRIWNPILYQIHWSEYLYSPVVSYIYKNSPALLCVWILKQYISSICQIWSLDALWYLVLVRLLPPYQHRNSRVYNDQYPLQTSNSERYSKIPKYCCTIGAWMCIVSLTRNSKECATNTMIIWISLSQMLWNKQNK